MYEERDEALRAEYLDILEDISVRRLVYIDESGVEHNIIKERCWCKKGEEVIGERPGKHRTRTSVIAALNGDEVKAPIRFRGTVDTRLFLYWLENFLIPVLEPRQVVIMDNASIHKSYKVKDLIEKAGCYLIYLPPYSPDLNPIENYWSTMKKYIRKVRNKFNDIEEAIDQALINKKKYFSSIAYTIS